MFFPPAKTGISEHPAPGSVVGIFNKTATDADVDRKICFYVIEAFRQGRIPSNAQIDETLQYVIDHPPVDKFKLSPEGQKLIQDARDIIKTARVIVTEKNADELFQNFIWHARDIDTNDVLPVDKEKAKDDGQQAVRHLRTILSLILTNSKVRKLLRVPDFSLIGRDLLA